MRSSNIVRLSIIITCAAMGVPGWSFAEVDQFGVAQQHTDPAHNLAEAFNALSKGDRIAIQDNLADYGYYHGVSDGLWGKQTEAALISSLDGQFFPTADVSDRNQATLYVERIVQTTSEGAECDECAISEAEQPPDGSAAASEVSNDAVQPSEEQVALDQVSGGEAQPARGKPISPVDQSAYDAATSLLNSGRREEAKISFRRLGENGSALGVNGLGLIEFQDANFKGALAYFLRAGEMGLPDSYVNAADLLLVHPVGDDDRIDFEMSEKYFNTAIASGYADSRRALDYYIRSRSMRAALRNEDDIYWRQLCELVNGASAKDCGEYRDSGVTYMFDLAEAGDPSGNFGIFADIQTLPGDKSDNLVKALAGGFYLAELYALSGALAELKLLDVHEVSEAQIKDLRTVLKHAKDNPLVDERLGKVLSAELEIAVAEANQKKADAAKAAAEAAEKARIERERAAENAQLEKERVAENAQLEKERAAKQARLEEERKAAEAEKSRVAREEAYSNVKGLLSAEAETPASGRYGFRDFRVGMPRAAAEIYMQGTTQAADVNVEIPELRKCIEDQEGIYINTKCYGLSYNFKFVFDQHELSTLIIFLGDYASSGNVFVDLLNQAESNDPFVEHLDALSRKYKLTYQYSETERALFNAGKRNALYVVFEDGQVTLSLERSGDVFGGDLKMYLTYRDHDLANAFLKEVMPATAVDDL